MALSPGRSEEGGGEELTNWKDRFVSLVAFFS
jgi:hypothetical protein